MWLCPKQWNLWHTERTWLCDYTLQLKIYPILRGPDYVIILSSPKSILFWGDLAMWLLFQDKNLSHSEGTWLCDYTIQPKTYPTLRGPDYVIILSSQKSFPFRGNLIMWLCPKQWNLWHTEGTWLCDYTLQLKIYPILRGPDYVIILSSPKSILFWGDLAMWLYP